MQDFEEEGTVTVAEFEALGVKCPDSARVGLVIFCFLSGDIRYGL